MSNLSEIRTGNFTSSEIFRLMKPGKSKGSWSVDAQTYIDECNRERRLGRSIEVQTDARPLSWGKCVEKRAFNVLGLEYTLCSNVTDQHPTIPYWVGTKDATKTDVVADLKCPLTLTSFCQLVDPYYENGKLIHEGLTIEAVRENHRDGEKFYWQIVSNAILTGKDKGELIIYVPYERELEEIKTLADGNPDYYWIWVADNSKLPYLIEGKHYKNVNVIAFNIHKEDKELLTERVLTCGKQLINP
jgi:hypothetical protein